MLQRASGGSFLINFEATTTTTTTTTTFQNLDANDNLNMLQNTSIRVYFPTRAETHFLFYVQNAIRINVFNAQSQKPPKTKIWKKAVVLPYRLGFFFDLC